LACGMKASIAVDRHQHKIIMELAITTIISPPNQPLGPPRVA
jgi:hypothetical protein